MLSQAIRNGITTANKIKQTQIRFLCLKKKDKCLYSMTYIFKTRYQKVIQNVGKEFEKIKGNLLK